MSYFMLNSFFVIFAAVVLIAYGKKVSVPALLITLIILYMLTAVFDNAIINAGIVAYDETKLSKLFVGNAPIEDFDYTLVACLVIPALWHRFGKKKGGA